VNPSGITVTNNVLNYAILAPEPSATHGFGQVRFRFPAILNPGATISPARYSLRGTLNVTNLANGVRPARLAPPRPTHELGSGGRTFSYSGPASPSTALCLARQQCAQCAEQFDPDRTGPGTSGTLYKTAPAHRLMPASAPMCCPRRMSVVPIRFWPARWFLMAPPERRRTMRSVKCLWVGHQQRCQPHPDQHQPWFL